VSGKVVVATDCDMGEIEHTGAMDGEHVLVVSTGPRLLGRPMLHPLLVPAERVNKIDIGQQRARLPSTLSPTFRAASWKHPPADSIAHSKEGGQPQQVEAPCASSAAWRSEPDDCRVGDSALADRPVSNCPDP
jgi:hypothetical protein